MNIEITFLSFLTIGIWTIGAIGLGVLIGISSVLTFRRNRNEELKEEIRRYDWMCDDYIRQLEEAKDQGYISDDW